MVSGTHASGKSTLIADFARLHPAYEVLPDPYEEMALDAFDELDAGLFATQLEIAAARLEELPARADAIAERGPMDFAAYLDAIVGLGRRGRSSTMLRTGLARSEAVLAHVDLWVILPLSAVDRIHVSEDEDPELREAMNDALLEHADAASLAGATVLEVTGTPDERLALLQRATGP